MKVIRKERNLLSINVLAVLFTWICIFIVSYFRLPLDLLLWGIVAQSFIKMGLTIRALNRVMPKVRYFGLFAGAIVSILFYISNLLIGGWIGCGIYGGGCLFLVWAVSGKIRSSLSVLNGTG